eukprot:94677-Amphidinium_carterae.1
MEILKLSQKLFKINNLIIKQEVARAKNTYMPLPMRRGKSCREASTEKGVHKTGSPSAVGLDGKSTMR